MIGWTAVVIEVEPLVPRLMFYPMEKKQDLVAKRQEID
jgi:hypothetical protein